MTDGEPMLTLDVRFTCDACGTWVVRSIRIGPNFFMGSDNIPDGWVVKIEPHYIRCWCPLHTKDIQ